MEISFSAAPLFIVKAWLAADGLVRLTSVGRKDVVREAQTMAEDAEFRLAP